jgi:hypothetical protein
MASIRARREFGCAASGWWIMNDGPATCVRRFALMASAVRPERQRGSERAQATSAPGRSRPYAGAEGKLLAPPRPRCAPVQAPQLRPLFRSGARLLRPPPGALRNGVTGWLLPRRG